MKQWYASVNYGLEDACAKIIGHHGAKDIKTLDSALVFSCENEINNKCVNNLFLIMTNYFCEDITAAAKQLFRKRFNFPKLNGRSFRVVVMDCGKLCAIPAKIMDELEKIISYKVNLSPNRANPDIELWLNRRNDSAVFFMLRMKKHASFDKTLKKGELRPDIVNVMLHEATLNKDSVVVDLFGGWGAIAAAVAESGNYKKIYSGDNNDACIAHQKNKLKKNKNCFINHWDGRKTPLGDKSADAIITDPPWGEFENININIFYNEFINETARILKPDGKLVFLTSALDEAQQALDANGFTHSYIPTKINGKNTYLFTAKNNL
ncbi:MAG: methyltransferase [Defluviitaleaceae bacterium]|nr:methyltransferase [Defluviitaleaceae bacterium]